LTQALLVKKLIRFLLKMLSLLVLCSFQRTYPFRIEKPKTRLRTYDRPGGTQGL